MNALRAPFPWPGGKRRVAERVWERLGKPTRYVEPFAGSLAVLLARPDPRGVELVNDADGMVANFWRAVAAAPREVARWADWPVSEVDLHARHAHLVAARAELTRRLIEDPAFFDPKLAGWWVWGAGCWLGGGWCADPGDRPVRRSIPVVTKDGGCGVHRLPRPPRRRPQLGNGTAGCGVVVADPGEVRRWMGSLARRLRHVRVICGDWRRTVTPACLASRGPTAVFLDPPYSLELRSGDLYGADARDDAETGLPLSAAVREWAIENDRDPRLRIALCGLEGEHAMPADWECMAWKAGGGWGNQAHGRGRANAERERIWFSPACLDSRQLSLPGLEIGREELGDA